MADTNFFPKFLADEIRNDYKEMEKLKPMMRCERVLPQILMSFTTAIGLIQGIILSHQKMERQTS